MTTIQAARPRASIRQDGDEVVLRYTDDMTGERIERRFWVPGSGGYVREVCGANHGTLGQQVCAGLSHRGYTLGVGSADRLLPLIRKEWASVRREEARERARLFGF